MRPKQIVPNLFNFSCAEVTSVPIDQIAKNMSSETGVSERSIYNIRKVLLNEGVALSSQNNKKSIRPIILFVLQGLTTQIPMGQMPIGDRWAGLPECVVSTMSGPWPEIT